MSHDVRSVLCLNADGTPLHKRKRLDDARTWLTDHVDHIKATTQDVQRLLAINAIAGFLIPGGFVDLDRFRDMLKRSGDDGGQAHSLEAQSPRPSPPAQKSKL
ncbi:hypothetical protein ACHAQA_007549 [Verticillium albo-atrum]